jgi:lipopolysaccharide transport system ATP-binding protein
MQIKERGATVLFCSHTLFHVEVFCDKALWIHQGQVQAYGQVSQVLGRYQEFLDGLNDPVADKPAVATESDAAPLSGSETSAPVPVAPGAARITAVRVKLDEQQGDELYGESGVSTLRMEIDFASDPGLPAPTAALVISSDAGRILATHFSLASGIGLQRDAHGRGTAVIEVSRLPLNKGRFRVGAYVLCERGVHVYQWIDPVAHLNLHRDSHDQGYFMLAGNWSSALGIPSVLIE